MSLETTKYKDAYLSTKHESYNGNLLTDIITQIDQQIISDEKLIKSWEIEALPWASKDERKESKKMLKKVTEAKKRNKERQYLKHVMQDLQLIYADHKDGITWFVTQSATSWEYIYGIHASEAEYIRLSEPLMLPDEGRDELKEIKIISVNKWIITYGIKSARQLAIDEHNMNASTNKNNEVVKFRKYHIEKAKKDNDVDVYLNGSFDGLKQSIGNRKVIIEYIVNELQSNISNLTKLMTIKEDELHLEPTINGKMLNDFIKNHTMKELFDNFASRNK